MAAQRILALIPARGGSKGIHQKNIAACAGRPLLQWTADAVHQSELVTDTLLSSDDQTIISVARGCGLRAPFNRPKELSQDETPSLPVVRHAVEWVIENDGYRPDLVVLLQPTSPLRTGAQIDEALQRLLKDGDADSIVSVTEVPHQYSPASVMIIDGSYVRPWQNYNPATNMRQMKPKFYARNGAAIYAFRTACLFKKNSIYGDKILPYHMMPEDSVDIDSAFDLKVAEMLLLDRE